MTEARANEIFRTKYPTGEIIRRNTTSAGYKLWVTFTPEGKVYSYNVPSYAELLNRLGFMVIYRHSANTMSARIEKLKSEIKAGGYEDDFFGDGFVEYTIEEIDRLKAEMDRLIDILAESIIEEN